MNDLQKLQNKNWNVNMNYRTLYKPEVQYYDEQMVIVNGVQYQRVEPQKPQTLQRIIAECVIIHNSGMELELLENILDRVEVEFLSNKVGCDKEEPIVDVVEYHRGWDNCLKELKTRLRE